MRSDFEKENGIVLVIVLWVLVLLGIMVGSYLGTIRTDTAIAGNWITNAKTRWAANAGIQLAVLKMHEKSSRRWTSGDEVHHLEYGDVQLKIRIADEAGKIDINYASEELLQTLFRSAGASEERIRGLVAEIMQRRLNNQSQQLLINDQNIRAMLDGFKAKSDSLYQNIEELAQLSGMNPEIMRRIKPLITTHSGLNGVNPDVASEAVLKILPGIEIEQAEQFLSKRQLRNARDSSLISNVRNGLIHNIRGLVLNVHVEAQMPDGSKGLSSVIVKLEERRRRNRQPYSVVQWDEPVNLSLRQSSVKENGVDDVESR